MAALVCAIEVRVCRCGKPYTTRTAARWFRVACSPECTQERRREAISRGVRRAPHRVTRARGGLRVGRDPF